MISQNNFNKTFTATNDKLVLCKNITKTILISSALLFMFHLSPFSYCKIESDENKKELHDNNLSHDNIVINNSEDSDSYDNNDDEWNFDDSDSYDMDIFDNVMFNAKDEIENFSKYDQLNLCTIVNLITQENLEQQKYDNVLKEITDIQTMQTVTEIVSDAILAYEEHCGQSKHQLSYVCSKSIIKWVQQKLEQQPKHISDNIFSLLDIACGALEITQNYSKEYADPNAKQLTCQLLNKLYELNPTFDNIDIELLVDLINIIFNNHYITDKLNLSKSRQKTNNTLQAAIITIVRKISEVRANSIAKLHRLAKNIYHYYQTQRCSITWLIDQFQLKETLTIAQELHKQNDQLEVHYISFLTGFFGTNNIKNPTQSCDHYLIHIAVLLHLYKNPQTTQNSIEIIQHLIKLGCNSNTHYRRELQILQDNHKLSTTIDIISGIQSLKNIRSAHFIFINELQQYLNQPEITSEDYLAILMSLYNNYHIRTSARQSDSEDTFSTLQKMIIQLIKKLKPNDNLDQLENSLDQFVAYLYNMYQTNTPQSTEGNLTLAQISLIGLNLLITHFHGTLQLNLNNSSQFCNTIFEIITSMIHYQRNALRNPQLNHVQYIANLLNIGCTNQSMYNVVLNSLTDRNTVISLIRNPNINVQAKNALALALNLHIQRTNINTQHNIQMTQLAMRPSVQQNPSTISDDTEDDTVENSIL